MRTKRTDKATVEEVQSEKGGSPTKVVNGSREYVAGRLLLRSESNISRDLSVDRPPL